MKVDMLSSLPDELLLHILSFLPINTSASTTILSRRWLHLWKYTTKLIITNQKPALKSHRSPSLQEFTVNFFANLPECCEVAEWLDFAFSRRVETLTLKLNGWGYSVCYSGPRLETIITLLQVPTTSSTLKVLRLLETKTDGEAIQFFLENFPLLEVLVIRCTDITSDVDLVGPSLEYLEIEPKYKYNFFRTLPIKVSAPKLTMLRFGVDTKRIVLKNVPKLVDMVFRCDAGATMHGFAAVASRLETLSISIEDPKAWFWIPQMPKLKKLVIDNCYDHPPYGVFPFPVTSFLRALPCLQEFQVKFIRLALVEGETDQGCGPVFRHSCLKRFKLMWSCNGSRCNDHIKLVRYVVERCVGLEEIEISMCDGTELGSRLYVPMNGGCVRTATTEERMWFENTKQLRLPAHIKLRFVNHYHKRS